MNAMPDDEPDGRSFEDVARALADEVNRAVERLSAIDLDGIAQAANEEAERARHWIEDLARSLTQAPDVARSPEVEPVHPPGPHPLAMPTPEQGVALAALQSGRWRIESGTFAVNDGPGPSDPLGLGNYAGHISDMTICHPHSRTNKNQTMRVHAQIHRPNETDHDMGIMVGYLDEDFCITNFWCF